MRVGAGASGGEPARGGRVSFGAPFSPALAMASEDPTGRPAPETPPGSSARFTTRALLLPDDAGDGAPPSSEAGPSEVAPAEAPSSAAPVPTDLDRAWGVTDSTPASAQDAFDAAFAEAPGAHGGGLDAPAAPALRDDARAADAESVVAADDTDDARASLSPAERPSPPDDATPDDAAARLAPTLDAATLDADVPMPDDASVSPPGADPGATAAATEAVNEAFDTETDAGKADDAPAASGVEGTLDVTPLGPEDFEADDLKAVLRTMMTSRRLDDKMLTLLKQGKGFFHIGSSGHEAAQVALGRELRGGHDAFCFYYRDLGTALAVGMTPEEVLQAHFAKAADPFGGGRQMPEHFGHKDLNILSTSSSVGAQYLPAVGFALAYRRDGSEGGQDGVADGDGKVVYSSGGEGSTSQGAFHEALNWAARESLPVLFHVQDNGYAISVPVAEQTAGGSIWPLFAGYTGLERLRYDGTDFFQAASAARAAVAHARAGKGPVALHADVVRLLPHSSSDDHAKYREGEAIEADRARDPIPAFTARLIEAGVMTDAEVEAMRAEIHAEIDALARTVEAQADPDPATATQHVYYEGPDDRQYEAPGETGDLVVLVDAINHALDEEMARDERVLVYGEDVGGGKGGVFTATRGLAAKHGRDRCFNSPLAEHSIIGSAVGLAAAGYKPVVEIQFADYVWPGMQQIRNQVASMRYRSNGAWACPMVIRMPCGGYIHGGLCHSQNVEAMFAHFPGLHVVMPSNAADAKGLLKSAIRGNDPVIFLEHKSLYRQGPARRPEPHADFLVPLGKAAVTREGTDLTIVTWGAIVYRALNAARQLEKEGVSVEIVDVRSMMPLDTETILASAKKTGRVLVAYEDHEFMGFGAEIAAQISDAAFGHLDAPVRRVAGAFSSIPYADPLEAVVLPQDDDVLSAAREVLAF